MNSAVTRSRYVSLRFFVNMSVDGVSEILRIMTVPFDTDRRHRLVPDGYLIASAIAGQLVRVVRTRSAGKRP